MQQFAYKSLSASIIHLTSPRKGAKPKVVSSIAIVLGPFTVASAQLGGRYSEDQALNEYRRNPQRFRKGPGYPSAVALGLVA